ncbi:hypothetical protein BJ085DRAFT_29273 [Dimargaris cristalligena]|uniref:Uncharacterized protein n=1 Tax=Dimargaris cristalligena TaxID=215637 RepID=A0A4P9ZQB4_9FUNG|nr:hypothetical protein BJ085DRAFT_29273 [Dimargaris cristalligena]|eukprot:RKP35583.1 hypothetical protein BJ085DRAFT_29273 [Dimargaris cristalligena]
MAPPVPNSGDGSLGSIHVEHFPPYPSLTSNISSNQIQLAKGQFPEFSMLHPGTGPSKLMSSEPSSPEGSGTSNPSSNLRMEVPQITGTIVPGGSSIPQQFMSALYSGKGT